MIADVAAIAPGWFVLALLVLLALAISWVFVEGEDRDEEVDLTGDKDDLLEDGHLRVKPRPYDQAIDEDEEEV